MPENLDTAEWNLAEALVNVLEPFKKRTIIMCADKYPTLSQYVPLYIGLKKILEGNNTQFEIINEISSNLRKELKVILLFLKSKIHENMLET